MRGAEPLYYKLMREEISCIVYCTQIRTWRKRGKSSNFLVIVFPVEQTSEFGHDTRKTINKAHFITSCQTAQLCPMTSHTYGLFVQVRCS